MILSRFPVTVGELRYRRERPLRDISSVLFIRYTIHFNRFARPPTFYFCFPEKNTSYEFDAVCCFADPSTSVIGRVGVSACNQSSSNLMGKKNDKSSLSENNNWILCGLRGIRQTQELFVFCKLK